MPDNFDASRMPSYRNPPVVEVVLGVQFEQLTGFSNAHLGAFWKSLDSAEWPTAADANYVPPQFEQFEEEESWGGGIKIEMNANPVSRIQVKNKTSSRMIQVQNTRFLYNWLGESGEEYPRYEPVFEGFDNELKHFESFLQTNLLGGITPNQWEITYVNHIPIGTVWNTPADWNFFRPLGSMSGINYGAQVQGFAGQWQFEIPDKKGRLYYSWQSARSKPGQLRDLIQLTVTARGPLLPNLDLHQSVSRGLGIGREAIVVSFHDLMTSKANRFWGG